MGRRSRNMWLDCLDVSPMLLCSARIFTLALVVLMPACPGRHGTKVRKVQMHTPMLPLARSASVISMLQTLPLRNNFPLRSNKNPDNRLDPGLLPMCKFTGREVCLTGRSYGLGEIFAWAWVEREGPRFLPYPNNSVPGADVWFG
jgi:hypothetical protein